MATYQSTTTSQALQNEKEQMQGIRDILEQAIAQRYRYYSHYYTFTLRFENDDTKVEKNSGHFQTMLKMLGLPRAIEVVMSSKLATWTLISVIGKLIQQLNVEDDRKLVIWHYAGHAKVNDTDDLCFVPSLNSRAFVDFNRQFRSFWSADESFDRIDVIFILDRCFGGMATRSSTHQNRTIEIVSAAEMAQKALRNIFTTTRVQNHTFTTRLVDEIAKMMRNSDISSISFSDIVAKMRGTSRSERLLEYALKLDNIAVRLSIRDIR